MSGDQPFLTAPKPSAISGPPPDYMSICYQNAGDWIRLANSVTWTLASVYLVAAVLAMNAAMQRAVDDPIRLVLAFVWVALLSIWIAIDRLYLKSARQARTVVERIEESWPEPYRFYTLQRTERLGGSKTLTYLLYTSGLVIVLAWAAIVTPVLCRECSGLRVLGLEFMVPGAKPAACAPEKP